MATRLDFLGLPLDCLTRTQTVDVLLERIARGEVTQHVVLNASKVLLCRDHADVADIVSRCGVVNADGISIVIAGRLLGLPVPERVTGIDLFSDLLKAASRLGLTVYLLGAEYDVVERCASMAMEAGVPIVGWHDGYWDDDREMAHEVARFNADMLFLAIPSPRKERFLSDWLADMNATVAVGVGGSFDVMAGKTKRAPKWMQKIGLEWLARLIQEPRRLARRYLVGNARFTLVVFQAWLRRRGERANLAPLGADPEEAPGLRDGRGYS